MAKEKSFQDPDLEIITIEDFTKGVTRFGKNGANFNVPGAGTPPGYPTTYSPLLEEGSAAYAVRCIGVKNIGLVPFPTYSYASEGGSPYTTFNAGAGDGVITMGSMCCQGASNLAFDTIFVTFTTWSTTSGLQTFQINQIVYTGTGPVNLGTVYSRSTSATQLPFAYWPFIDNTFWINGSVYVAGVITFDPTFYITPSNNEWVAYPSPTTGTGSATGVIATGLINPVLPAYVNGRTVFMSPTPIAESFYITDVQAMTNISVPNFFSPEQNSPIGTWGSQSTGEFFFIYQTDGANVIYGDILYPQGAYFLPGITGTGAACGKAVSTPLGLIYVTDTDGVYVWDGGNTSTKISDGVPDTDFVRTPPPFAPNTPVYNNLQVNTHNDVWGNWAMFANNWVYDCINEAWWQCEDPNVQNFQVHTASHTSSRYFYSSVGSATTTTGGTIEVGIAQWDRLEPVSTYTWISNPIPISVGSLVSLQMVEITASNPTASIATVVITPTVPPGQTPFSNQNVNQSQTFTIPPYSVAYKASKTLGYTDYNVEIKVVATNLLPGNQAPVIHSMSLGFTRTRTSRN